MGLAGRTARVATGLGGLGAIAYLGLVSGAVPVDLGVGRRVRELGPLSIDVAAPREAVFDMVAAPYDERAPRALRAKVQVLERGENMVLAAHYTPLRGRLTAMTVETVRFSPPGRVDFRLVRGPVPHVVETFRFEETEGGTRLHYTGELGTDLWSLGERWGDVVTPKWESVVMESLRQIAAEAERRSPA